MLVNRLIVMRSWPLLAVLALSATGCASEAESGASTVPPPTTTSSTSAQTTLVATATTTTYLVPTATLPAPVELVVVAGPPAGGIGVVDGETIVLMDYAGAVVATGAGYTDVRSGPNRVSVYFSEGTAVIGDRGPVAEPGPAEFHDVYSSTDRGSLLITTYAGERRDARELLVLDPFVSTASPWAGPPPALGIAPEGILNPVGAWRWAIPSEDGTAVLGQWSGECEIPTAFVIGVDGAMSAIGARGHDWSGAPGSFAAGWTPNGLAIVGIWNGGCGGEATPGVYLVDIDDLIPIYLSETDTPEVFIWLMDPLDTGEQYYYNRREELLSLTYQAMGVRGAGEPSHGGDDAYVGFDWEGGFIGVLAIDVGWVLDQISHPAADTYDVGGTKVGVFPHWELGPETDPLHVFFCGDTGFVLDGDVVRPAVEELITALGCG